MTSVGDTLVQEGLTLHRRGALADAIARYRQVLQSEPEHSDALYYLASAYCAQGEFTQGLDLARRAIAANPKDARAHNLLGRALNRVGRNDAALASFGDAVRLQPDFAEAFGNRGGVLSELGRLADAVADYERAIALRPDNVEDLCNCGAALDQLGRYAQALNCFDRALALRPDFAPARFNRATTLASLGRYPEALAAFDHVLAAVPAAAEAWNSHGSVLKKLDRNEEALASFDRALSIRPDYVEALNNRGSTLSRLGRHAEAVGIFERMIASDPKNPDIRINLANALGGLGHHEAALGQCRDVIALSATHLEAHLGAGFTLLTLRRYPEALQLFENAIAFAPHSAEAYDGASAALCGLSRYDDALAQGRKAIELNPRLAGAHYTLGGTLQILERYDDAIHHYDRALAIDARYANASWNKALIFLHTGRFTEGWPLYERRFDASLAKSARRPYRAPEWNGERIEGTLFAWGEEGLGDDILAASMVDELAARASTVVLQPAPRLVKLFARSFPAFQVTTEPPARIDAHVGFGSLGRHLRPGWQAFPRRQRGYLVPDAEAIGRLRARLADGSRAVVGLSWRSINPNIGRDKSAPLPDFAPLLRMPGIRFIDLQYGDTRAERELVEREFGVRIERPDDVDNTNDLDALAALIAACDAVVTISNTTAHLAGAVGTPTLVLVPAGPARLWYWFAGKAQSPWYPRVEVCHQLVGQGWAELIAGSQERFEALIAAAPPRGA